MSEQLMSAFLVGLLGSTHCLSMCGGIASLLTLKSTSKVNTLGVLLYYNIGRLLSYSLIGALAGGAFASLVTLAEIRLQLSIVTLLIGGLMILMALYVSKIYNGLIFIEKIGHIGWRQISPLAKRLLPLRRAYHALAFGMLWGWLPCGLVYSTLTWSLLSANSVSGALIMGAFGLGTLPAMVLTGASAQALKQVIKYPLIRYAAASILAAYGFFLMYRASLLLAQ